MPDRPMEHSEDQAPACFQVDGNDNVATALGDLNAGDVGVIGPDGERRLRLPDKVGAGHKVALRRIAIGELIIKFGVPIGRATRAVGPGEWVHLHNCTSNHDERSQTLDPHTGATTDTAYE